MSASGRGGRLIEALGGCRLSPGLVLLDIPGCLSRPRRRNHVSWRGKIYGMKKLGGGRRGGEAYWKLFLPTGRGEMMRWTDGEVEG